MAYTKYAYTRVNWKNKSESLETPLGKTNLNRMDSAIYQIAENVDVVYNEMDAKKLDKTSAGKMLRSAPTWDADTGILTFQFYDGTEFSVDFNIEKIPVSFSMDSSGLITMTTADGTQWTANIADMIPNYKFENSDRIVFTKTKNEDGSYNITADIVKGSITGDYLEPNYLANVTTQASKAEASANSARTYADNASYDAKLAQSYAVGGSGIREGEDTDNAKKYAKDAKDSADRASEIVGGNFITQSEKGIAGGVASLDDNGKIPVNQIPDDISVNEMTGATADKDGTSGTVPAPTAGQEKLFLRGDGTWGDVSIDVDDVLSDTSKNPVQNKVITLSISDTKNSKVTFTSNDTLAPTELSEMPSVLASKETHASLLSKISTVFKNMRYIIGLLGSTDISKETLGIGDGTVTGAVTMLHKNLSNLNNNFTNFSRTIKLKIYTELSDIGLSTSNLVNTSADVATVVTAMPDKSIFIYLFSNGKFGLKSNGVGVIEIIKHNINRVTLKAIDSNNKTFYYGTYHGTSGFSGWYAVTGTLLS